MSSVNAKQTEALSTMPVLKLPPQVVDAYDSTRAAIFILNYGENHRYIRDLDYWIHWDGLHWEADSRAQELHNSLNRLREGLASDSIDAHLSELRRKLSNQRSLASIVKYLQSREELVLRSDQVDSHLHLVAFQNAIYNTDTFQYIYDPEKIRPMYMLRRMAVALDQEAKCPQWLAFLDTIFQGDQELIRYVQKAVGLSLSGLIKEERLFFAYGSGANGKSTFFEVLGRIFGSFHHEIDSTILINSRHQDQRLALENMANLRGIRFATSNEIPERASYNDLNIKQLCSRDQINAKVVYQSACAFTPSHKLWIRGNHKPKFNIHDDGMLRRICLIPFAYTIPKDERKSRFEDELLKEKKGILNWIIQGWNLYKQEGMNDLPATMQAAMAEYTQELDDLQRFIDEECNAGESFKTAMKDFTTAYNAWCKENSYRQSNSRELANELRKMGYDVTTLGNNKLYIKGLAITAST
jgi:putative DNA primase/helicase